MYLLIYIVHGIYLERYTPTMFGMSYIVTHTSLAMIGMLFTSGHTVGIHLVDIVLCFTECTIPNKY